MDCTPARVDSIPCTCNTINNAESHEEGIARNRTNAFMFLSKWAKGGAFETGLSERGSMHFASFANENPHLMGSNRGDGQQWRTVFCLQHSFSELLPNP